MNKELILTFIKKNVLLIICSVVVLLAIGASFYPIAGWYDDLKASADTLAGKYQTLQAMTKSRKLPMSDPNQADPGVLTQFPSKDVIKQGQEATALFTHQSEEMLKSLTDLNRAGHTLLVADEFPLPHLDSIYFDFAKLYKLVLTTDPTVSAIGDATANPPVLPDPKLRAASQLNLQNDILHGAIPPTIEQIKQASDDLWKNTYEPQEILKNGVSVNDADLKTQFGAEASLLPLKLKGEVAKKRKIYVEKDAFTVSTSIVPDSQPRLEDMWYAQMQLWVQQDLCNGIAEENQSSPNILSSPVKRLLAMQIPPAPMYIFPPASAAGGTGGVPAAAKATDAIPPMYTVSVTGRYSNGMYDVIPFRLVVDVDATKVNEFIATMSRKRLITITNENEFALDADAESARGYLYGPHAVVRLQLDGEILFLTSWTDPLLPERVKQAMSGQAPPIQGAPGAPGGFPGGGMPGMPGMPPGLGPGGPMGGRQ